jgi:hypothetical protein
MSERRRYWRSVAALAIALPTAIAVHSWESFHEWRAQDGGPPTVVEKGQAGAYSGAEWRLVNLRRLPGSSDDARVVLVEFEAALDNPASFAENPCTVRLTDETGRIWEPVFLTESIVRKTYPEAADKPRCNAAALTSAAKGARLEMAESFIVPASARDFALRVEVMHSRPESLLLKSPEP